MKFLHNWFYKAIAKITGDDAILWEKGVLGQDPKYAKVDNSTALFAKRFPIVVTKEGDEFVYTVYDLNHISVSATSNDPETYSTVFSMLHENIHEELRYMDENHQPFPTVSKAEEIRAKEPDVLEIKHIGILALFAG